MNILAFDTSLNKTYLALFCNNSIYTEIIESTEDKYHSAFLVAKIVDILKKNNISPQDINFLAVNIGPGSFTGIRVGLTVARVFAQNINANTIGINSLELISTAHNLPAITVLDARKNKVYLGNNEKVELVDLDNIVNILKEFNGTIVSDTKMQEFLKTENIDAINYETENIDYGKTLIEIAQKKIKNNEYTKWQGLKPLYIQPPPIHEKKSVSNAN